LPSGRLYKRLWWSRWSDGSRYRKATWNNILHPEHRKKRLLRSRLSDFLSRRMALRTHNLPSRRLKERVCWSRWAMFKGVERTFEIIFCIPCIKKATWAKSLKWCFK
jgi:hypothetical protein